MTGSGARRDRDGGEDGSVLLLTIFYAVLALVVILGVVAASTLYLERKRLFSLADGAALAGAEAFDLSAVRVGPEGLNARLDSADVAAAVDAYLAIAPTRLADVEILSAASVDGQSASVALRGWWRPPVISVFLPVGVPIEVRVTARSVFNG